MELWRDIKGFKGAYKVSSYGRVINIRSGRVLKLGTSNHYALASLWVNNKGHGKKVHSLVAKAFLSRPEWAQCINHKDGDRLNNHVENLEWTTYSGNIRHAIQTGLRKTRPLKHGVYHNYSNNKCRCEICRDAHRKYQSAYMKRRRLLLKQ